MSDALFLSLWFPSFETTEMMPRMLSVLQQFPFSTQRPGVTYLSVQPVNWQEATVLERRFQPGVDPAEACDNAGEFLQADYAYVFECFWDLWMPEDSSAQAGEDEPVLRPMQVKFVAHGGEFDDRVYQQDGHIEIDVGLDGPFLYENEDWTSTVEGKFRANVHRLISFTQAIEKNCGIAGRVLWSESDENLAQKLISRLQKVQ